MESTSENKIESAEIVLPCQDLDATLEFFTAKLNFCLEMIFPADNPSVAVISGFGLRIRLEKTGQKIDEHGELRIRIVCETPEEIGLGATNLVAPNGIRIELVRPETALNLPELKPSFVLNKFSNDADWIKGRAGMRYRDLIPDRQGGRFIASHIHIPVGGEVPDYVHFHNIHFQMIYCYKGWAKLVYEDQGAPFILNAGDCVLQPPKIRHRVLESSDNLEVIEVSCPAEHETYTDHELNLPTSHVRPERDFHGQNFVRHISGNGVWNEWRMDGFESIDTGIGDATNGLASVKTIRSVAEPALELQQHDAEFVFMFVLNGAATLIRSNGKKDRINAADSFVIPGCLGYSFSDVSKDLELLEVCLPAEFATKYFSGNEE